MNDLMKIKDEKRILSLWLTHGQIIKIFSMTKDHLLQICIFVYILFSKFLKEFINNLQKIHQTQIYII